MAHLVQHPLLVCCHAVDRGRRAGDVSSGFRDPNRP
jgi:hypothetical protein